MRRMRAGVGVQPFPSGFRTEDVTSEGAGDMWAPLAAALAQNHTVVVPDLRGMGLSSHPEAGYDKKTQGRDVARMLDTLKIQRADVVGHDIGNMVAYAFAAQHPQRVVRLILADAPLPGIGPWDEITRSPLLCISI